MPIRKTLTSNKNLPALPAHCRSQIKAKKTHKLYRKYPEEKLEQGSFFEIAIPRRPGPS